ncbi:PHD finger protein 7-like [Parasteatoda tepidariorum]|uniref:PHD finger protein 7-like n=1 Tax=Parasteatoda tepidariorum TaxID=114398 RepID=UPI001C71CC04|nr:PHD finger protein 7-like [Parasteatoda tepidariorum]
MEKKDKLSKMQACILCRRTDDDELLYGKFYHRRALSVHHKCMFFTSGLVQRSKPSKNGILGFLLSDIQAEASRGKRLKCFYCKKIGATVGCIVKMCRRVFHFPCGVQYHSLHQYFGNFSSYCASHKPKQKSGPMNDPFCYICYTPISKDDLEECLYSPCCKNNWFHRLCLQQYALSAGRYFFKCPLCNNVSHFLDRMLELGIDIPDKDAEWELENNAFEELYSRPGCDASVCRCLKGKDYDGVGGWKLLSCSVCGSHATHPLCRGLHNIESWMCNDCVLLQAEIKCNKKPIDKQPSECKDGSLIYTCDSVLLHELLRRRPIVKIMKL